MKSVVYWQQKKDNHHPTEAAKRMLEWSKIPARFASINQSINQSITTAQATYLTILQLLLL